MPMRATTVRFSEDLWHVLEDEAARQGVSAAHFVREATVARLAFLAGRRGADGAREEIESLEPAPARRDPHAEVLAAVLDPTRLQQLRDTFLLDTPADEGFDRLTSLTATVLNVPVALVSLVDSDRQFFKSCHGLGQPWASERQTPLSHSFCQHVVHARRPLVVTDAREHPVLSTNQAIRDLGVVAYAGAPLMTATGHVLGTLCAIDHRPRHWTPEQIEILSSLAGAVLSEVQLRAVRGQG